jgi:hypothetical protein
VTAAVKPDGTFTAITTIPRSRSAGSYRISAHCGGIFGETTLVVQAPPTLQVRPPSVTAGDTVTVSGSLGPTPPDSACATSILLLSDAFVHTNDFAGVPAITAAVKPDGTFTVTTRIPRSKAAGPPRHRPPRPHPRHPPRRPRP